MNDQRKDFLHKLSRFYVNNYEKIIVEDLNIKGMLEKIKKRDALNRHIHDASWGEFIRMLSYKAEGAGGIVIRIPPHDTSKKCTMCE